jgi:ubiquinone biosynthesis monooxygenase Coq7
MSSAAAASESHVSPAFDIAACQKEVAAVHRSCFGGEPLYADGAARWSWLDRELSSNVAGETGAVCIYEGAAAALALRGGASSETLAFVGRAGLSPHPCTLLTMARALCVGQVDEHRKSEAAHLALFLELLPPAKYTALLPAWRVAGRSLGFAPTLIGGERWLFLTVDAPLDLLAA